MGTGFPDKGTVFLSAFRTKGHFCTRNLSQKTGKGVINMKYFKKMIGDRIYLSPQNDEDVEIFTEWLNDFETTDYIGISGRLTSLNSERKYFEDNANAEASFAIVTLDGDKMIGTVSLEDFDDINRCATLGIFIGDKDYRDKGYGTEAINMILEFGFKYRNLHSIKLDLMEFNERALKCYKKCGFKEYGRRRKCKYIDGKYYDSIEMDILESEFKGDYIRNKNI